MKKTTRTTQSPAPATPSAPAAQRAVAAPPTVAAAKPAPAAKRAPASAAAPALARFEPAAAKATATTISARIDVGFGNRLYLRGEGAGLAWHQGVMLENRSADLWTISLPAGTATLRFKFLVNDELWSVGEDYIAAPGVEVTHSPRF